MNDREHYVPSPATGTRVQKDGENWTLVIVRDLHHAPELVWEAITDPAHLVEWAPFDADRNLAAEGTVKLTTVGAPGPHVCDVVIRRAEAPRLLEYNWGGGDLRWELEPLAGGTRLTLWHNIDRRYITWGAAGWHVCFDVLEQFLNGHPLGRIVGPETMKLPAWQQLTGEYAKQFGGEPATK